MLSCLCSNSVWASGELTANFNKPFDMIAITNDEYKQKKATSPQKSDLIEVWRPLPDLNRCRRRERAVSWAGLDEGDVKPFTHDPLKDSGPKNVWRDSSYKQQSHPSQHFF